MREDILYKIDRFDARSWLESKGIPYGSEGKNIGRSWIGIICPFCGDSGNHFGIGPNNQINCWVCGKKGNVIDLIKEVENCGFKHALNILDEYQDYTFRKLKQDILTRHNENILPSEARDKFPQNYLDYLVKRRFDPEIIIPKYKLLACPNFGDYAFRIIIPCYFNKHVVNFTAVDTTGKKTKYKHCPNNKAITPMKNLLYNIDVVYQKAIIVEGTTDVWRLGDGAIATMGIEFTTEQIKLLIQRNLKTIHIMFDADKSAQLQAKKLAQALSNFVPTNIITLPKGDPADLSDKEALEIRKEFL